MLPDPREQPCLSAEEAFAILGIDRKTGYRAIKQGAFPVDVFRVGRRIRVPTAALLQLLVGGGARQESEDGPRPRRLAGHLTSRG
jgi:predicted DNA-binding transcriptional regulator AlpA